MADCPGHWLPGPGVAGVTGPTPSVAVVRTLADGTVVAGGLFTWAGNRAANNLVQFDPATHAWTGFGAGTNGRVRDVVELAGGDLLVGGEFSAAGGFAAGGLARYTPSSGVWTAVPRGEPLVVTTMVSLADGDVIVGGSFGPQPGTTSRNIARLRPATGEWFSIGIGTDGEVLAIADLGSGDLIVGGDFDTPAANIARFNTPSGQWSPIGTGTDGPVHALAVMAGDVVVGGAFTVAGSAPAHGLARCVPWSGHWSTIGSWTGGAVLSLAVRNEDEIAVGGELAQPGSTGRSFGLLRVSTQQWEISTGLDSTVRSIARLPSGALMLGGDFTRAGSPSSPAASLVIVEPPVAFVSSTRWLRVGRGFDSYVSSLAAAPRGGLIAGGNFVETPDGPARYLAVSDEAGLGWSDLGGGIDPALSTAFVNDVEPLSNGDLIVVGGFGGAGGVAARNVARYRPSTESWHALGSGGSSGWPGVSQTALVALELPGGDVIVGGFFTGATSGVGTVSANRVARYYIATGVWTGLGTGVSNISGSAPWVTSLLRLDQSEILVAGQFDRAPSFNANSIARYNFVTGTWSPVAGASTSGVTGFGAVIELSETELLLAGWMPQTLDGIVTTVACIARFDRVNRTLGPGVPIGPGTGASALARLPSGDVAVGGHFSSVNGIASRNIAVYHPSTGAWSTIGSGVDASVYALAVLPNGDLAVGGAFTFVGSTLSAFFARYRFGPSCPADFNCSGDQPTLDDLFGFLAAYFATDPRADINGIDGVTIQDILEFLVAWFSGC